MSKSISKIKGKTKQISVKNILEDRRKRARFILLFSGLTLIFIGFLLSHYSNKEEQGVNSSLSKSFQNEPVKVDEKLLGSGKDKSGYLPPERIVIPDLNIDLPVKESRVIEGYWEVMADSANWGVGSAYPQEDSGNQVIFAHAREGLFLPLKNAKLGQKIYVLTESSWYEYEIENIKEVLPTSLDVIAETQEKVLTLYTCSGFEDRERLIIKAKSVDS